MRHAGSGRQRVNVLIAGIAGASLGTELLKSLRLGGNYDVYGCDISGLAYGMYDEGFIKTFCVDRSRYVEDVIALCVENNIHIILPGAEEPTLLLSRSKALLDRNKIILAGNDPDVIALCSDKARCFEYLAKIGIRIPEAITVNRLNRLVDFPFPCIVKPATGSGGSSFVFLAQDREEALIYVEYLQRNGKTPIIQEYIPETEGEFTVGTLTLGGTVGSVALRRIFNNKLSVQLKSKVGLISTGYSQGLLDDFPDIRRECEKIACALNSNGPLNIQGRMRRGRFIPFEINPRFSASTFLRALAGFNEVDLYIRYLLREDVAFPRNIKYGYYLRSLTEKYIPMEAVK